MDNEKYTPPRFASPAPASPDASRGGGQNEAVGCMLRKLSKGYFVKLDADIFYQLLEHNLAAKHNKGKPVSICFWKKGIRWSVKRPVYLSRFVMKAKKGQFIDHINRDIFDNQKLNLRTVNRRQNMLNSKRRKPKTPFCGIYMAHRGKLHYWLAQYLTPEKKQIDHSFKFSIIGLFLAAVEHDKMVVINNEEDYAPLNFQMFKIPAFKKVLLSTDIKLLRSIYLGRKNKNSEKTKPEKKNTVYKNQFFLNFGR